MNGKFKWISAAQLLSAWKGGASTNFRLTDDWQNFRVEVPRSKFPADVKKFTVDFSTNPGAYQYRNIEIKCVKGLR